MKRIKTYDNVVYLHKKKTDGEIFYIGMGCPKRPYDKRRRSIFWNKIVNKHGYDVEIISRDLTLKDANEWEILLIGYYGRRDKGLGTLVNLSDGGCGNRGYKHTDEHKKRLSEMNKGKKMSEEAKRKLSISRSGCKFTEEHKEKLKKNHKGMSGRNHSNETKQKLSEARKGKPGWNKGLKQNEEWKRKRLDSLKKTRLKKTMSHQ